MTFKEACKLCRQNTGSSFLDSGSIYGYLYNKEIPKNLIDEENLLISTPHWLYLNFDFTEKTKKLQLEFDKFVKESEKTENKGWPELIKDFLVSIGVKHSVLLNSYNYESNLDQVIQYIPFTVEDNEYWFLQIHTGCDVRGGYTPPIVVKVIYEASESLNGICPKCKKEFNSVYKIEENSDWDNGWTHKENLRWKGEECGGKIILTVDMACDSDL